MGASSEATATAAKRKSIMELPGGIVERARLQFTLPEEADKVDKASASRPVRSPQGNRSLADSEELARLRSENARLRQAARSVKEAAELGDAATTMALAKSWEFTASSPARSPSPGSSPSACSEGRLRAMLMSHSASAHQLRSAIQSVDALLQEARRELDRKETRERRAAYEKLHQATDRGDEDALPAAIEAARASGVDAEELARAEAKLKELHSMTAEQRAQKAARELEAKQKKEAFLQVKKDNVAALEAVLNSVSEGVRWQDWKDHAGRNLWRFAQDLRATAVQEALAPRLGRQAPPGQKRQGVAPVSSKAAAAPRSPVTMPRGVGPSSASPRRRASGGAGGAAAAGAVDAEGAIRQKAWEASPSASPARSMLMYGTSPSKLPLTEEDKKKAKALKAVVQDDGAALEEVLETVPIDTVAKWENRAGTTLLTLAEERGSANAYCVLAKAMGIVRELKRDFYEERETVWVFVQGDVQPKRATVLEDTPEESDTVLLEFWDGDEPAERVDRNRVRRMGS